MKEVEIRRPVREMIRKKRNKVGPYNKRIQKGHSIVRLTKHREGMTGWIDKVWHVTVRMRLGGGVGKIVYQVQKIKNGNDGEPTSKS